MAKGQNSTTTPLLFIFLGRTVSGVRVYIPHDHYRSKTKKKRKRGSRTRLKGGWERQTLICKTDHYYRVPGNREKS